MGGAGDGDAVGGTGEGDAVGGAGDGDAVGVAEGVVAVAGSGLGFADGWRVVLLSADTVDPAGAVAGERTEPPQETRNIASPATRIDRCLERMLVFLLFVCRCNSIVSVSYPPLVN